MTVYAIYTIRDDEWGLDLAGEWPTLEDAMQEISDHPERFWPEDGRYVTIRSVVIFDAETNTKLATFTSPLATLAMLAPRRETPTPRKKRSPRPPAAPAIQEVVAREDGEELMRRIAAEQEGLKRARKSEPAAKSNDPNDPEGSAP